MKKLYKTLCFTLSLILIIELFPLFCLNVKAQTVTYDLSPYCNQIDKSMDFFNFVESLDEETPKVLVIPDGQVLLLNHYFTLPSNTTLKGGTIEFVADSQYADVYNEAYIINRHSRTYWNGKSDTNIIIQNTTLRYDCSKKGRSLIRMRDVSNLTIIGCKIEILNKEKTQISHNAAIDLFKGCTNAMIANNEITLDNPNGFAGGAVWIRSATISGNDPIQLPTSNVQILNNTISSNSCDELLAVGSSGFHVSDVLIQGNTFIRENGSKKNLMLGVCPSTYGDISNVTITQNIFYMNNAAPILNREIIRVGGVLDTTNYPFTLNNISLIENRIIGNLSNAKAIVVKKEETNGASVWIEKNEIKNTGASLENSYGIISSGPNIVMGNQIEGVETSYVLDAETKQQTAAQDSESSKENTSDATDENDPPQKPDTSSITDTSNETNTTSQSGGLQGNGQSDPQGVNFYNDEQKEEKQTDKVKLKLTRKKTSITLKWKRVLGAKGYVVYGARKGKKLKKLKTIKKGSTTSWTQKKLKRKTTYKYVVKAYTTKNGKKKWLATSKTCFGKTK